MSVLRNLEDKIAGLVEGTFGRVFRSEVRPVEVARKLAREMDEHKTVSVSRTYVPNEYAVWLSPEDRERSRASSTSSSTSSAPTCSSTPAASAARSSRGRRSSSSTDERLALGEFGIQARMVAQPGARIAQRAEPAQAEHGHTMVYSAADRMREPRRGAAHAGPPARALLSPRAGATSSPPARRHVGRSRECDVVLDDPNVSRRHAEVRRAPGGTLDGRTTSGSTNGVGVNGRDASAGPRAARAQATAIELGTAAVAFELE